MKLLLILAILVVSLSAQDIALVKSIKGSVNAKDKSTSIVVKKGDWLSEKMTIYTAENSGVTMIFKDNSVVVLGSSSILILEKYLFKPSQNNYAFKLFLEKGTASFESGKIGEMAPDDFTFKTPDATVGIRGTKFMVKVQ